MCFPSSSIHMKIISAFPENNETFPHSPIITRVNFFGGKRVENVDLRLNLWIEGIIGLTSFYDELKWLMIWKQTICECTRDMAMYIYANSGNALHYAERRSKDFNGLNILKHSRLIRKMFRLSRSVTPKTFHHFSQLERKRAQEAKWNVFGF